MFGFKCFLLDSGVPEFPPLGPGRAARRTCAEMAAFDGLLIVARRGRRRRSRGARRARAQLPQLPGLPAARAENARDRRGSSKPPGGPAAGRTSCTCPARTPSADDRGAQRDGLRVTAETCPHYLVLRRRGDPRRRDPVQVLPADPRRGQPGALWAGWPTGSSTASSPTTPRARRSSSGWTPATSARAWGGIASLQLGLPAVWTEARRRGYALADVVRWMAERPAALAGLPRKGRHRRRVRRRPRASSPPTRPSSSTRPAAPQEPRDAVRRPPARGRRPARPGCAARQFSTRAPARAAAEPRRSLTMTADRAGDRPTSAACRTSPPAVWAAASSRPTTNCSPSGRT